MHRKLLLGIAWLAFAGAGAGSAVAADIAARPMGPPPAAAPALVPEWVGFYIGINGGGGGAHQTFESQFFDEVSIIKSQTVTPMDPSLAFSSVVPPSPSASGGVFGGQAGYNWQWGPAVGGLEIDFDGADIHGTSTFVQPHAIFPSIPVTFTHDIKIDELASARARLGYLIFPNWLLYGTAGLGFGHTRFSSTAAFTATNAAIINVSQIANSDNNQFGWVAGVGLEWMFFPHWLLRGEYLHYDFGRVTEPAVSGLFVVPTANVNVRTTVDIGRAAISYKF